jgi:hypothetical protein
MNHKRTSISIVLATVMLVSLFAVVSSATGVSGTVMAGTGPAATSWGVGPALFAVDTSGHVWWNESAWSSLGGVATSSPAATTPNFTPNVVLDVFVRGTNGALYERSTLNNGASWGAWSNLGGRIAAGTGPAACSWGAGRVDVFVQGTDGALWHKGSTNSGASWSNWQSLGGKLTSSPAASPPATNQIGVFVRGTDGACWYKDWTGTAWSSWKSLGGQLAPNTGPGVLAGVFVQGTDHQLWRQELGEAGSAWSRLPACPEVLSASSPAAGWSHSGHPEVFVSTTSGNLMCCFYTGSWTPVNTWEWFSETSPP